MLPANQHLASHATSQSANNPLADQLCPDNGSREKVRDEAGFLGSRHTYAKEEDMFPYFKKFKKNLVLDEPNKQVITKSVHVTHY